ncbi:MAG TPA: D-sedoheptulose 7-phosphate isomerase [Bacteroidales bacterium]|nr:D-sedoheptulose 7-phosphate isomerase [Bacteroidales bacterium]HQB21466.1 D-sedoheptulose 7-phosphate isomerase [Bacteroidales bacterium]
MIRNNFLESSKLLNEFISESKNFEAIELAAKLMIKSINNGGKIISCGNGGSMSDAMHFAEELSGRFKEERKALPAIAIADPSHITCVANDYGFDFIFSRFVEALGNKNDVLLAISTSGNSKNVINAVNSAKKIGMPVVALTGKDGGKLKDLCDIEIRVPHFGYSDRIQEIHIKVIHSIIDYIETNIDK